MEKNENIHFMDKVVDVLKKSAIELEEFQVKAALGKAEAQDKYEEIKKNFNGFIHDSKSKIRAGKEKVDGINTKFDELRVQLALGKAESIDSFRSQKKQILATLRDLEVKMKSNETLKRMYAFVLIEIEKFKLQLDLLEQKFEHSKGEVNASFEKGKQEFIQFIDKVKSKYTKDEETKEETKWEHFQDEISEAFSHFKNAFVKH
jgi:hypothetical protein